ncbi:hypothetical protein QOZ80_5AG0380660 [Eleusine coracana subsp. coracana]|nr:hypothetical protein QOZ80_5AG0380660 [Eleusine coracana subsp. coracana]
MAGYPPPPAGAGYPPYGGGSYPPPPTAAGYPSTGAGYPQYGGGSYPPPAGAAAGYPPYGAPSPYNPAAPYGGGMFATLTPSTFAPGTDPTIVACFQAADRDRSGMIDDGELQAALSGYSYQSFSIRTVHLLMYIFTNTNLRVIGPKEFTAVFQSLQNWRAIFERFDRDRSAKFDKTGGRCRAIEYDNFIECCLTVKGLTEKFKEKDTAYSGSANFSYETFMLTVLPFLIA